LSTNTILASAPLTSTGYHLKANGTTLGNSLIWDNGTNVGIGNTNTSYTLDVSGTGRFTGNTYIGGNFSIGAVPSATSTLLLSFTSAVTDAIKMVNTATSGGTWYIGDGSGIGNSAGTLAIANSSGTAVLKIASTGAATFSSSVQVGSTLSNSLSVGLSQPTTDTLNHIFAGQGVIAGQAAGGETDIGNNWYYYSGFKYRLTNAASNIKLNGDVISFERATSGNANTAITFAESMRITSGGNVGIGTTAPLTKLDVRGTSGTTDSTLQIIGNGISTLLLGQNSRGGVIRGQGGSDEISFWTGGSGDTGAGASGTERMRLTSDGKLLLNATSSNSILFGVAPANTDGITVQTTTTGYTAFVSVVPSGGYSAYWVCGGNTAGYISHPTTTTTLYYTGPSDERLKNNIKNWNENVLDLFKDIKPKTYNHIKDNDESIVYKGFIAQEMVDKFPEAYGKDREGFYSFNPSGYIPYLVKAIQEMNTKLDEQNQTIQNLQEQINILAK
jgi:hypothetical protein